MLINVKVFPGAKKNKISLINNQYKVYLTQAPEKGKANKKLIDLLAEHFSVAKSTINIINGERNKEKTVQISNLLVKNYQNIGLNPTNRKKLDYKNKKYLGKIHCWDRWPFTLDRFSNCAKLYFVAENSSKGEER